MIDHRTMLLLRLLSQFCLVNSLMNYSMAQSYCLARICNSFIRSVLSCF